MADTKIATSMAAFFVPHECLSGAKISIISETAKLFYIYFSDDTKTNGRRP